MIDTAIETPGQQYAAEGKVERFQKLRPFLGFSVSAQENHEAATAAPGLKLNTVKADIRRLREQ